MVHGCADLEIEGAILYKAIGEQSAHLSAITVRDKHIQAAIVRRGVPQESIE